MYNDSYIRFPINSISGLTSIEIEKNKRNYRKQDIHLQIARSIKEIYIKSGNAAAAGGRKPKGEIIKEWQRQHPNGTKTECISETKLSKSTVYKYWR